MAPLAHLGWPFFGEEHRQFAAALADWAGKNVGQYIDHATWINPAARSCVHWATAVGCKAVVPAAYGGLSEKLDVRTICAAREILSWHDSLADFAFAMQGLGTASISLFGSDEIKAKYLPPVRDGRHIAAFALSEPEAGSDVSALATTAIKDGPAHVRIDGLKTWISNGGIADHYVVFARTGEAPGPRDFRVRGRRRHARPRRSPAASRSSRRIRWRRFVSPAAACRWTIVSAAPGEGFKVAMATLDIFRSTVAAAALGMARRAFDEMIDRAATRNLFGAPLADLQLTQAALADSAIDIDAAALLIYRAAWEKDRGAPRITREASMAKAFAPEMAQRVIDRAVQIFGGNGVRVGVKVEALYREIRALRIYEGATEVQKLIVARELLKAREAARRQAAE